MVLFYLIILTFIALVAYVGYDVTMRLIAYIDIVIRHKIVLLKLWFMRIKLEARLEKESAYYKKLIEETKNDR
jgi:hypothetical protein